MAAWLLPPTTHCSLPTCLHNISLWLLTARHMQYYRPCIIIYITAETYIIISLLKPTLSYHC